MCVCATSIQCPKKSEESVEPSGTRMLDDCEPPSQCWRLNPGPQQVQQMLLTTEAFLQAYGFYFSVDIVVFKIASGRGLHVEVLQVCMCVHMHACDMPKYIAHVKLEALYIYSLNNTDKGH